MSSLGGLESIRDYSQGDSEWVETIERGRTIKKRRASVPASTLPPLTLFPPNPIEPTLPGLDLPFPYVLPSSGMNHPPFAIPTDPALFRLSTTHAKPQFDTTSFAPLPDFPSTLNPLESFPHPSTIPAQSTLESLAALCGNLYENGSQPSPIKATFPDQEHASSSPQMTNKVPMKNASRSKSRQRKNQVSKNSSNDPVRPVPIAVPPREALRRHHCVHIGCNKSFVRPSALVIHVRSHSGDRPYACPCCYRGFGAACNLTRHMKQIHPEIDVTNVAATEIPDIDVVALTPSPSPPLVNPALSTAPNGRKRRKSKKKKKVKYRIVEGNDVTARDEVAYKLDPGLPVVKEVEGEQVAAVLEKWTETRSAIHSDEGTDDITPLPQFVPQLYAHTALPLSPLSPVPEYVPLKFDQPPPPLSSGFYHSPPLPQIYPLPSYPLPHFDPSSFSSSYQPPPIYYPFPSQPPPPPIHNFQLPFPPRYPAPLPLPFPPTPPPTASINPQTPFDLSQVLMLPPFEPLCGVSQRSPVSQERGGGEEGEGEGGGVGGIEVEGI